VAHALGVGLRLDVAWFGLIERTMLRFDAAKTINDSSPWQFWFGIQHPFEGWIHHKRHKEHKEKTRKTRE